MTRFNAHPTRAVSTGVALGLLAALAGYASPVVAQESPDDAWFPWYGCWETEGAPGRPADDASGLCIVPNEEMGVDLLTVTAGQVTATRTLITDGEQRPVSESGCSGWERSSWSEDWRRVFLRSELTCDGGSSRVTSGVIAMAAPSEWVDVQTIEAGGFPVVRVQRYRPAADDVAAAARLAFLEDRELAVETARTAAAASLSIAGLAEASRELSKEALEMMLFELGGTFEVDGPTLIAMADAGVPESAIDLVVALAYPDVFNVNSEARMVGYRPAEPTAEELAEARREGRTVYGMFYDPFDPYGFGYYNRYGYGYSAYSPFGWGSRYGWTSAGGGVVIIQPPAGQVQERSRFVRGRGFTRGGSQSAQTSEASRSRDRAAPSSSTSRTSPAATSTSSRDNSSSSSSSGSSSSGRSATRRGGGG